MRLLINIPKEFEQHFQEDRFEDSLHRLSADAHLLAGKYEQETVVMLIESFKRAVPVPEHGRLIDADALMQKDNDDYDIALLLTTDDEVQSIITKLHIQMQRVLKDAPTIIQTEEGDNG